MILNKINDYLLKHIWGFGGKVRRREALVQNKFLAITKSHFIFTLLGA
jgi:hypothetical protein